MTTCAVPYWSGAGTRSAFIHDSWSCVLTITWSLAPAKYEPAIRKVAWSAPFATCANHFGRAVPSQKGERSTARRIDGGAGRRSERKRMLLCNGADIGCVCSIDHITDRESGQTSPWCCTRENLINRFRGQSR